MLLTEDRVDQCMLEILRVKVDEFNEYARRGDLVEMEHKGLGMEEAKKEGWWRLAS